VRTENHEECQHSSTSASDGHARKTLARSVRVRWIQKRRALWEKDNLIHCGRKDNGRDGEAGIRYAECLGQKRISRSLDLLLFSPKAHHAVQNNQRDNGSAARKREGKKGLGGG